MSFIAGLAQFLGVVFLVLAVVGLIVPSAFKDKKTGEIPKRSQFLVGGAAASIIAFAASAWLSPSPVSSESGESANQGTENQSKSSAAISPGVGQQHKTLGVRPEEFRQSFNNIVGQVNTDYKIAELDIEEGDVNNTFKRMLSENIGLVGTVNKSDGTIRELMVIVGGSTSDSDNLKPILVVLSSTQALNPSVPKDENSKVAMSMLQQAMDNVKTGQSVSRKVGALEYTASASEVTGLLFAVSQP